MSRFISIAAITPRNIRLDDCPLTWSGRTCEECIEIFQERLEKYY